MSQLNRRKLLLLAVIILISLNLRPPLTGIGPLIGEIRLDTGLSNSLLGLLTTLPMLAFGVFSILTSLFTRKIGTEGTMAFALAMLTFGIFIRIIPSGFALFTGTAILGIGIALGNVLLPGIVKKQFPNKTGLVTGIYSGMLGLGASIASGISVPLSKNIGFGWHWALGIWGFVSLLAFLAWLPQLKVNMPVILKKSFRGSLRQLGSSPLAWQVSIFMGVQSFSFYILVTWLPEILIDRGMEATTAGWVLSAKQAAGVLGTFIIPAWAASRKHQRLPVVFIVILEITSLFGLMAPTLSLVWVWASILGFCIGGSFGMALLFIVLRSQSSDSANELSGMSQSVGYTFAALGPVLFGALFDWTQNWFVPLSLLVCIAFLKLYSGWKVGIDQYID